MVRVEPVRELVSVLIKKEQLTEPGPVGLARLISTVQQNAFL